MEHKQTPASFSWQILTRFSRVAAWPLQEGLKVRSWLGSPRPKVPLTWMALASPGTVCSS